MMETGSFTSCRCPKKNAPRKTKGVQRDQSQLLLLGMDSLGKDQYELDTRYNIEEIEPYTNTIQ